MNTKEDRLGEIKEKIAKKKSHFREKYGVLQIGIFGSFTRNEATAMSDLDVLVTLKEPISYFKFFDLEKEINALVGIKVDLATNEAIKLPARDYIMKDLVLV